MPSIRANLEKQSKLNQAMIVEANQKLDEMSRALNEADSSKKKLQVEQQDLQRQIEETENGIAALGKSKISLTTQLEDTRLKNNIKCDLDLSHLEACF